MFQEHSFKNYLKKNYEKNDKSIDFIDNIYIFHESGVKKFLT